MDSEFDDLLDQSITSSLSAEREETRSEDHSPVSAYMYIAKEISSTLNEESPRLSDAAQVRHLALIRSAGAAKRRASRPSFGWVLRSAPRWALIATIAALVVLIANGITGASAGSLPGSPLYPVKRLAEQSNVLFAPTAGERARIWMGLASLRLDEIQSLVAREPRVDLKSLDDIDESILHALTEIAATRGKERIVLLQQIIELSRREQNVLDDLADAASTDDRPRFRQSVQLLEDVAHIADSAQSNLDLPSPAPTGTATDTALPTVTPSPTATDTVTAIPSVAPSSTSTATPTLTPEVESAPTNASEPNPPERVASPSTQEEQGQGANAPATPDSRSTEDTGSGGGETPKPSQSEYPEPQKSDTPKRERTGTPEAQKTDAHQGDSEKTTVPGNTSLPSAESGVTSAAQGAGSEPRLLRSGFRRRKH